MGVFHGLLQRLCQIRLGGSKGSSKGEKKTIQDIFDYLVSFEYQPLSAVAVSILCQENERSTAE